ncbi:SagB-type dehydrogenase domain-containing protein [Yoonia tamlensis]|uniref:SagB-type dehydrogenase domain-containing protein n=1 Tax=Yoonia tamlensis TaxID=390270 RepID=A0A1I6HET3_9RHOB|nr:SagB/ThcOx family dehydrogenase [Yoonia tamlensis]SFR52884.1 SagB-type dehydrogenase domain-containing protein [Yoonia tamlensis]
MRNNVNDPYGLSQLFHLNSEPWIDENQMPNAPFSQETKSDPHAQRIALPDTARGAIEGLAAGRRSTRAFADNPLALCDLAAMLRAGYQVLGPDRLADGTQLLRRPVPSAGGLYPLEVYALVRNVDGLAKGIYHYDSKADDLALIKQGDWEDQARDAFLTWSFVAQAPVVLCLGAVFARTQRKYGPRGYRYVLIEAGHVAQNICLAAAERDLATLCLGGYADTVLNRLIGLDGQSEAIIYALGLGHDKKGHD